MKFLIAVLLFFILGNICVAQDPHFSQYHASPLTLNPAMTGYINGDYRFSTNYRKQWSAIGTPYTTGTFSYDDKIMQNKLDKDVFALGIMGLYDQSLNGGFKSLNLSASVAYHKSLDADKKNNIALGFQFTYASRYINSEKLTFASQFTGNGFDRNLPSNENFGSLQKSYLDINTGLMYTYSDESTEFYLGASAYHLTRPNMSFLKNEKYNLPLRYSVQAGSKFTFGENANTFFLSGIYMNQAKAVERTIGGVYGLNASDKAMIYAGLWYRVNESIIPYVGLDYNNLQLGVSYDIVNNGLKDYAPKTRSIEFSLNITGKKPTNVYTNYKKGRVF